MAEDMEALTKLVKELSDRVGKLERLEKTSILVVMGSIKAKIYGVSWNGGSSPTLTRTDASVGMVAAAGVDAGVVTNNFDTAEIFKDITEVTDALGNVFIRIPRFYIEKTAIGDARTWRISKEPFGSAYLPACFASAAYVDVGKYKASLSGANKLESKSGTYPLFGKNIVEFRGYAAANGAGYYQMDIHVVDIMTVLFYAEFATLNSQSIMSGFTTGQYADTHKATVAENAVNRIIVVNAQAALYEVGQTISVGSSQGGNQRFYGRQITSIDVYDASNKAISFDGAAVNISVDDRLYNTGAKAGLLDSVVAKSGSIFSNSSGKHPCKYRGIENPWGSMWQFIDGVNINEMRAWVCRTPADYASNLFAAPYVQLSYANINSNGYVVASGLDSSSPFANFPISITGGSDVKYFSDYYYQSTGQRIALLGGSWYNGANAGLSYWYLNVASSYASIGVGARLLRTPL